MLIANRVCVTVIMKFLVVVAAIALTVALAADEKEERPKTFRRLIPADVLRG
jgi:hypothetical protein